MPDGPITVYADYVCPFCYIGQATLRGILEDVDAAPPIHWHPFDLRAGQRTESGEIDLDVGPDDSYFDSAWQQVERLAEEYDIAPPQRASLEIDSRNAQRVSLILQEDESERWAAFDRAVYDAHWHEGRDIGDPSVLRDLAESVGVDGTAVANALDDSSVSDRLEAAFASARRNGVSGVPTFVYGDRALRGAVPPAQLRDLVDNE